MPLWLKMPPPPETHVLQHILRLRNNARIVCHSSLCCRRKQLFDIEGIAGLGSSVVLARRIL
eukprot:2689485-Amphidinium_carterae.1